VTDHLRVVCASCDTTNRVLRERLGPDARCGSCKKPLIVPEPIVLATASFDNRLEMRWSTARATAAW